MITVCVSIACLKAEGLDISTPAFARWLKKNGLQVLSIDVKYITLAADTDQPTKDNDHAHH